MYVIKYFSLVSVLIFSPFLNAASAKVLGFPMALNGNAKSVNSQLVLTKAVAHQISSAFITTPFIIENDTSFSAHAVLQMIEPVKDYGADGIAFILQNDPAKKLAIGSGGGGRGYTGITKSIAIEFTPFFGVGNELHDRIGIDINGSTSPIADAASPIDLNSGRPFHTWIDYNEDSGMLNIFVNSNALKPGTPVLSSVVNLFETIGTQAFVGFSAATGAPDVHSEIHKVLSFDFYTTTAGLCN